MRSRITWAAMWLAGAVLAAAGITVTVSLLGTDLLGPASPVLSQAQVRQQLARRPAVSASAAPPGSAQPGGPAARTSFSTAAGMVSASCPGGLARLTSWQITTPGYRADGYVQGPAAMAWIKFKSSGGREQTVTVTCRGGRPQHVISNDDNVAGGSGAPAPGTTSPGADDHGGSRGRGGSRHGGGDG
ncbi:MAG TPA: hypothetical protein VFV41_27280 [Streptosporangiaceae bacterium]|nr:hypothetical protein [Streptosporangiaceae bacterium]